MLFRSVISSNTVRIEEVEDIITSAKAELLAYHTHQKVVADFENLNNLVDSTKSTKLVDRDNAQTKMIVLKEAIQQVRKNIKKAIAHNEKATAFNTKIDVILEQTADFEEKLRIKTAELEELRELAAIVDILKKSFSTNGLIAYKIESLVKDLEDEINKYLAELSAGRFQLNFNLKGEKLNIQIIDEGRIVEIEALSSGEFGRVNTATLLGIRKVMNILSKSKLNLLILDEVMGVLDDSGKEKLVEILLEETEINTFIVSHEYTHPLLNKINITKENNISRLENG